jgi:hypothetical protein
MGERMYEVRRRVKQLGVLGISTLHPRYPIPQDHLELMKQLEEMEKNSVQVQRVSIFKILHRWVGSLLYVCREFLYLCTLRLRFGATVRRLEKEAVDLLVKSWCFGQAQCSEAGDFYYGKLEPMLQKQGARPLFLLGDARGRMSGALVREFLKSSGERRVVPEPLLVPLFAPFAAAFRQLRAAFAIRRLGRWTEDPQLAAVCRAASLHGVEPAAVRHSLDLDIARRAVATWKPKAFVTLYEGQPWEKMAWHGARQAHPSCRIVGYQHTVVMPHAQSLLRPNCSSWELSVPDVVLCLGPTTRHMLSKGHEPFGSTLISFGSFRHPNGASAGAIPDPRRKRVLVLPVGVLDEAVVLFNFAMELAKRSADTHFIFRCHPVLPFHEVQLHLGEQGRRLPGNVEVSRAAEITIDFNRSSCVLYHGSSAVLYAVLRGLKPLYYVTPELPDTDPLFEMREWKEPVFSVEEAQRVLGAYAAVSPQEATRQWQASFDYAKPYSQPVGDDSVVALPDAIGRTRQSAAR